MAGDITGVNKLQPGFPPDVIGTFNGFHRCRRQVLHRMMWIEPGHVPRSKLSHLIAYPSGNTLELLVVVVHGGYDVGYNFNVHVPFIFGSLGYLQNLSPVGYPGQLTV